MQTIPRSKLTWYFLGVNTALLCIIGRLTYLQIYQNSVFYNLSQKNFLRYEKVVSPRGNIFDCKGRLLATNKPVISLYWQGTGNKRLQPEQLKLITYLNEKLGIDLPDSLELAQHEQLNKQYPLQHDIDFEKLSLLIEQFPHHPNLIYTTTFKRFYPHPASASHILGYIGGLATESTGIMGLEKICNESLKGESGQQTRTVNSRGKNLAYENIKKALSGDDIHTTLDLQLSQIACEAFPEDTNGCMLIMDSDTGNLQVILSRPAFDPNIFLEPLSPEDWQQLQIEQPFLNRASNACYPPASLFKLVSMAAGLETGIINQSDVWFCCGHTSFAGRDYHCSQRKGHGPMTTVSAIAQSCNIPFFEIGKKIKIDTLADYAHRLGLGSPTRSLLPEKSGLIPTRKWKRETKGEPWWPGETLSAAIGQTALLVTPIQIARMFNGIFHGFLVTPRLLESEPIEKQPVDLSESTRDFLKRAMRKTIEDHGTGVRLKRLKDITIYAKTGTAQVSAWEKRDLGKEHLEHAWFAAHVTYKNRPPFVMVILLEHVGSSSVATNLALKYLRKYMQLEQD